MVQFQLSHPSLWRFSSAELILAGHMSIVRLQCLMRRAIFHQASKIKEARELEPVERRVEFNGILNLH